MYSISNYSKDKAKLLGVKIRPSTNKNKKIGIYDANNQFIFDIGAMGYKDYSMYLAEKGKKYADERRRLYRIRHEKDISKEGSRGYYSWYLLWNGN